MLKFLSTSWKSYFNKKIGKTNPPKYKRKNGENVAYFNYTAFTVKKNGKVSFAKKCLPEVELPKPLFDVVKNNLSSENKDVRRGSLCMIRVIPRVDHYVYEFIYEKKERKLKLKRSNVLGIDLGVNNLVTCVSNLNLQPFLIAGNVPKAINQFYNKQRSHYSSIKDLQGYNFETKRLRTITDKRNRKVKDFFHKTSAFIVKYCIQHNIGRIVIGYNTEWKQEVKLGKRNNQNFVQLPFLKLVEMIKYKAKLVGMLVYTTHESYTSKCSALDGESIEHHDKYIGKRLQRSVFRTVA